MPSTARIQIVVLLFITGVSWLATVTTNVSAQQQSRVRYTAQQRAAIRAMPILHRPDRRFHVYGNTVRRIAQPAQQLSISISNANLASTCGCVAQPTVAAAPEIDPVPALNDNDTMPSVVVPKSPPADVTDSTIERN